MIEEDGGIVDFEEKTKDVLYTITEEKGRETADNQEFTVRYTIDINIREKTAKLKGIKVSKDTVKVSIIKRFLARKLIENKFKKYIRTVNKK